MALLKKWHLRPRRTEALVYSETGEVHLLSLDQFKSQTRVELLAWPSNAQDTLSWYGGAPQMPQSIAWPQGPDGPMLFLAQLNCAEIPHDLWGGAGPQAGWLLFFISASWQDAQREAGYQTKVIYIEEIGPAREAPRVSEVDWLRGVQAQAAETGNLPRWPVCFAPHTRPSEVQKRPRPKAPEWPDGAAGNPITFGGLRAMLAEIEKKLSVYCGEPLIRRYEKDLTAREGAPPPTDPFEKVEYENAIEYLPPLKKAERVNTAAKCALDKIASQVKAELDAALLPEDMWSGILKQLCRIEACSFKWREISKRLWPETKLGYEVERAVLERKNTWSEQKNALLALGFGIEDNEIEFRRSLAFHNKALASAPEDISKHQNAIALAKEALALSAGRADIMRPLFKKAMQAQAGRPVTDRQWDEIKTEIAKISYAAVKREVTTPGLPPVNALDFCTGPLTAAETGLGWQAAFETRREREALLRYSASPASLPDAVVQHFQTIWNEGITSRYDLMGGLPEWDTVNPMIFHDSQYYTKPDQKRFFRKHPYLKREPRPFHQDNALLLQLFSNQKMGWIWGDVSHISFIIPRADLEKCRFDRVRAIIAG